MKFLKMELFLIIIFKKLLLLDKNIQNYQLTSLLISDGIALYRIILVNEYDIRENSNWHLKSKYLI